MVMRFCFNIKNYKIYLNDGYLYYIAGIRPVFNTPIPKMIKDSNYSFITDAPKHNRKDNKCNRKGQ